MLASLSVFDRIPPVGMIELWVRRKKARLFILERVLKNLITNAGKAAFAAIQIGTGTAPSHIAIGTGTTAAAVTDTTLETEVYRTAATQSLVTTVVTDDASQHIVDQAIAGTYAISEAGLLNAASGGDLYSHQVFTAVTVYSGDIFRVVWKLIN